MPLPWLERSRAKDWFCAAIVMCLSCGFTALISRSGVPGHARAAEEIRFQETVITPSAPVVDGESPTLAPPPCNCWKNALESNHPEYFLTGYAGASYFDTTSKTSGGGLAGLNLNVPIYGALGFVSRAQINSYSGGTQYGGSVGLAKASYAADDLMGRLGGSVLIDQFTDTGIGSPYMVQSQYAINYALTNEWRVGARYIDPIHSGTADLQSIIPGATGGVPIAMVDVIEANVSYSGSMIDFIQFGIGYIDDLESVTYRTNITQPISERLAASVAASYDERIGRWSGFLGLTYDFSPKRGGMLTASRSARGSNRDVVRGAAASWAGISALIPEGGGVAASSEASSDFSSALPVYQPYTDPGFDSMDYMNGLYRGIENTNVTTAPPCPCPSGFHSVGNGMCEDNLYHYQIPCGSPL
jgi:hypothetical protein